VRPSDPAGEKRLLQAARSAEVRHLDETSWWAAHLEKDGQMSGNPLQWLRALTDEEQTLYRVGPRRKHEVVHEVPGSDFPKVLVSDCLNIYDEASTIQHKRDAHHLKAISKVGQECGEYVNRLNDGGLGEVFFRKSPGPTSGAV
jgi:hypothetical protein